MYQALESCSVPGWGSAETTSRSRSAWHELRKAGAMWTSPSWTGWRYLCPPSQELLCQSGEPPETLHLIASADSLVPVASWEAALSWCYISGWAFHQSLLSRGNSPGQVLAFKGDNQCGTSTLPTGWIWVIK
jgi:hypothetical protein